jgi:uncharacterized protein YkwD
VRSRFSHPSAQRRASGRYRRTGTLNLITSFVFAIALASSATLAVAPTTAQAAPRLDRTERTVIKLINSYRARHGRARLRASGRLNRAADRHSRAMLAHDFFAHASRNGTAATTRARRSSRARSVGENIAFIGSGQRRMPRLVVSMWIDSAKHREVLLHPSFRRIGVGRRAGDLSGNRGNAITADFASRR